MSEVAPSGDLPPSWRGRLHRVAFFVSVPAGIALVLASKSLAARLASALFALSLIGLFGVSAAYHSLAWSSKGRRRMQRLDHSMIFVLIAGTYTPLAVLVLEGTWSVIVTWLMWGGAAVGVGLKVVRIDGFRVVTAALYIVLGWMAVLVLPQLVRGLSPVALALILAGGLCYTVGAIILALRRPNPNPRVFGYHEVWHSLTLGGSACHYLAVLLVVLAAS